MKKTLKAAETGHFHIDIDQEICGGNPIIKGTRVSVASVAGLYMMGLGAEEIKTEIPHLSLAQVYDAISYFLDHRDEIAQQIEKDMEENVSTEFPAGRF